MCDALPRVWHERPEVTLIDACMATYMVESAFRYWKIHEDFDSALSDCVLMTTLWRRSGPFLCEEYDFMATVTCARCSKSAEALPNPPMGGQLGLTLQERVCAGCYADWVGQQNLLINHYGLNMADSDDRKRLIAAMKEYLGLETA